MHRRVAVAVLFATGCTCGGSNAQLDQITYAYCDYIDRCPDSLAFPIAYRNRDECKQILDFVLTCRVERTETPSGDDVPTLKKLMPMLDMNQAQACAQFLKTVSCSEPISSCDLGSDAGCNPCSAAFSGLGDSDSNPPAPKAGIDQKCENSDDCAAGLYCINAKNFSDGGETCRVCKPLRPVGGDCANPPRVPCVSTAFCDRDGTCVAMFANGTACEYGGQCTSQFCHPVNKRCADGKAGAACTMHMDCVSGFCDPANSTCANRRPNGGACTVAEACQNGICDTGSSTCGKPDGATCSSSGECQGYCDSTARMCKAPIAAGQACTSSEQCASRYCNSSSRVCVETCNLDSDCPSGSYCSSNSFPQMCRAKASNGSNCDRDDECSSGFCNGDGDCAAKPGIGSACSDYGDCFPKGYCSGGTCKAFSKPGEMCSGFESCAPPSICKMGTCQMMSLTCEPGKKGQQCTWLQVCEAGSYCNPLATEPFTCEAKKNVGDSCLRSLECPDGTYCESRTCTRYANAGAMCNSRTVCAAGLFCDESVTPNVCAGPKAAGASCQEDSNCQSGQCEYVSGAGQVCKAACFPVPPGDQPACKLAKCTDFGFNCGTFDAGCSETVSCGNCNMQYQTCGGGGSPNVCGCTPTAACHPRQCNTTVANGCGTMLQCNATCGTGETCTQNLCGCASDRTAGPSLGSVAVSTRPPIGGGVVAWDSVGNIAAADDAGVHIRIVSPSNTTTGSEFLLVSGFGFNLPSTASVNGIEVRIRRRADGTIDDSEVDLFKGVTRLGRVGTPYGWTSTWGNQLYGGQNFLWGYPLTPADVNAADFGVGLMVTGQGTSDGYVDSISMTIHYAYRCDCAYACTSDSECGSDGCGGMCGTGTCPNTGPGDGGVTCTSTYCTPLVWQDPATGLQWLNEMYDRGSCAGLSIGGLTGWRVPTIDELRGLVRACPATMPGGACGVTSSCTDGGCDADGGCAGCPYQQGPAPNGCYIDKHLAPSWCNGLAFMSSTKDGTSTWSMSPKSGSVVLQGSGTQTRYKCVRP